MNGGVAGVAPAEGVAEDREAGWSEGETSPLINYRLAVTAVFVAGFFYGGFDC